MVSKKFWAVALLALSLLVVSCDLDTSRTVRFYASSTFGTVSVEYFCGDPSSGDYISLDDQVSPWSVEVKAEKGDYVELFVGDLLNEEGLIARIYVDGKLFKEDTGDFLAWVSGYVE